MFNLTVRRWAPGMSLASVLALASCAEQQPAISIEPDYSSRGHTQMVVLQPVSSSPGGQGTAGGRTVVWLQPVMKDEPLPAAQN